MSRTKRPNPVILWVTLGIGGVGVIGAYFGAGLERFWANWLLWFIFLFTVALGSLFIVALEHLVNAKWSVPIRRVPERLATLLIPAIPIGLVALGAVPVLYPGARPEALQNKLLAGKAFWLGMPFFSVRALICFVLCVLGLVVLVRGSVKQDVTKDPRFNIRARKFAPAFMAIFALVITLVAFDWIAGLTPEWYSDIFGVYLFAGAFLAGMGATSLSVLHLKQQGRLEGVRNDHLYNLGGFMFAFTVFWSYIGFAQYLLMWYANLPDEVIYYKIRLDGLWHVVTLSLAFFHFVLPFAVLVTRDAKGHAGRLRKVAILMLGAHLLDLYWLIFPALGAAPRVGWPELSFAIFFLSLGLLWVRGAMEKGEDMPVGDPFLQQGLEFHLMIDRYVTPAEFKRLISALLVVAGFISIVAFFAFLVVPGMRNVNEPGADPAVAAVQGDTGWLDPTDYPAAAGHVIPPVDPKTVMTPNPELLARGRTLFTQTCAACHGPDGKGDGLAGANLNPKPRNFTSSEGWKNGPRLEEIYRTLDQGIKGSSMASYNYLSKKDRMALVHLVQSLGRFDHGASDPKALGELEHLFASAGEVVPNRIPVARAIEILAAEYAADVHAQAPGASDQEPRASDQAPPVPAKAPPALETASPSIAPQEVGIDEKLGQTLPLDLVLRDEEGRRVTLRSLIDKPTLLTLNYFRCVGICTPQLNAVAQVANLTEAVPGRDFQILTVSFDERDTSEVAAEKRTNYLAEIHRPFPPSAWRFLTGDAATTRALADAVGFRFKRVGDDFVHAAALIVISPKGTVTRYMYGATYLPADVQMAALEAARNEARPTIAKFLDLCFGYDPQGRRLVLTVTSAAATVTVVGAVVFIVVLSRKNRRRKHVPEERA